MAKAKPEGTLKLGKMTSAELAKWFGMTPNSFKGARTKKFEELKLYAKFEIIYGGINILEIYDNSLEGTTYSRQRSETFQQISKTFDEEWSETGIDTCSNVSRKIIKKLGDELHASPATTYNYTWQSRNEKFGKPFAFEGKKGSCIYLWCKVNKLEDGIKIYTEFTQEEIKIKNELLKKHFGGVEEQELFISEMVKNGELTEAEAYRIITNLKGLNDVGYMQFLEELSNRVGSDVAKATKVFKEDRIEWLEEGT